MIRWRVVVVSLVFVISTSPSYAQDPYIVSLQDEVDRLRMLANIQWLEEIGDDNPVDTTAAGTRFVGSELARSGWIVNALRDSLVGYGWDVGLDAFTIVQDTLGVVPCWNVIARRDGQNADAMIVIGAHWDSINSRTSPTSWDDPEAPAPAANDNGSGIATLLEIGRILGSKPFRQDVELCFFGGEELWMRGSRHHVDQLMAAGINVAGYFNVDMVGYDYTPDALPPVGWDMKLFYDTQSTWFKNLVVSWIGQYSDIAVVTDHIHTSWANSDVHPFWQADRPAVGFWEGDDHAYNYDNRWDTHQYSFVLDPGPPYHNLAYGRFLEEMCRTALACFAEWADVRQGTAVDPLAPECLALSSYPNPFRPGDGALLRLALPGAASETARVEIFDVGGRHLRSLAMDGTGEARWDGRDEQGEALPAGLYLARTTGLPAAASQRIVLLR